MGLTTQILRLPENIFYQAIDRFQGSWAASASTLMDNFLMYRQTTSPRMAEYLHPIRIFSNVINTGWLAWDAIQLFKAFYAKDSLFSVLTVKGVHPGRAVHIAVVVLAGGALLTLSRSLFRWKNSPHETPRYFLEGIPEEKRPSVTLSFESPLSQVSGHVIYIARIVMNLATACLSSEQSLLCSLNAAGLAYSLLKTMQLKWLKFSRLFDYARLSNNNILASDTVAPKRFLLSYHCPLFPNLSNEGKCMICQEDNPSYCFCPYTPMDEACLVSTIFNASNDFDKNLNPSFRQITVTRYGVTSTTYHADISMPQQNLPKCPQCNNYPSTHFVEGKYWDWNINLKEDGQFRTVVQVIPDPLASPERPLLSEAFWARLGIIYSIFQSGLATMQHRHAELADKILSMQSVLSLFDAGLLIQNYIQLYRTLYQRYIPSWVQQNIPRQRVEEAKRKLESASLEKERLAAAVKRAIELGKIVVQEEDKLVPKSKAAHLLILQLAKKVTQHQEAHLEKEEALEEQAVIRVSLEIKYRISLCVKMGLAVAVLAVASASAVSLMHRLTPLFNLTDLLKKVVGPEDLSNIKASWSVPWLEYASQCILMSRIVVNLALAFFSTHRISYFSSAFFQTLTLLKLSKLSWIQLERSFTYPAGPMWGKGSFQDQDRIKSLHTSFTFFIPPFISGNASRPTCTTVASHVESILKAAYNYTTQFFKNSIWEGYWWVTRKDGIEISRKFTYDAIVKPSTLSECACKVGPFLKRVTAWAQDAVYGKAVVNIKY